MTESVFVFTSFGLITLFVLRIVQYVTSKYYKMRTRLKTVKQIPLHGKIGKYYKLLFTY